MVAQRLKAVLAKMPAESPPPPAPRPEPLADLARVGEPLQWSDIIPAWPEEPGVDAGTQRAPSRAVRWPTGAFPVGSAWASVPASPLPPDVGAETSSVSVAVSGLPAADGATLGVPAVVDPAPEAPADPEAIRWPRGPADMRSDGVLPREGRPSGVLPVEGRSDGVPWVEGRSDGVPRAEGRSDGVWRPDARVPLAPPAWVLPDEAEEPEEVVEDPLARLGVSEPWAAPRPASPAPGGAEGDETRLSGAGAFGAFDEPKERRLGLRAFDPGRRGVRALAAVAVLVIVVAAFLAWRARPRVEPVATPSFEAGADTATGGRAGAPVASASGPAELIVAVEGKVRKPGVVHLPAGSRVADALQAAGGADPGVDVAMLNLARKVVDGELILVGVTPSPGASAPAPGGSPAAGGLVNLNTATLADLDTLPGVGPVLAQRILDARTAQGGFKAVSDLRKVDGIGDARYEQLKDLVTM